MNRAAAEAAALESREMATHAGYKTLVVQVDVTKEAEVDRMVEETVREFGRIDYAFNSAGVGLERFVSLSSGLYSAGRDFFPLLSIDRY